MSDDRLSPIHDILKSPSFRSLTPQQNEESPRSEPAKAAPSNHEIPELRNLLLDLRARIDTLIALLGEGPAPREQTPVHPTAYNLDTIEPQSGTVIEGVFDGEHMIDAHGKQYTIPPNYASKSKLVEGDMMKLTITPCGGYVYKQIAPTPRRTAAGIVKYDAATNAHTVLAEGKHYHILKASITYYKLEAGMNVAILIPQDSPSRWAAIEHTL